MPRRSSCNCPFHRLSSPPARQHPQLERRPLLSYLRQGPGRLALPCSLAVPHDTRRWASIEQHIAFRGAAPNVITCCIQAHIGRLFLYPCRIFGYSGTSDTIAAVELSVTPGSQVGAYLAGVVGAWPVHWRVSEAAITDALRPTD